MTLPCWSKNYSQNKNWWLWIGESVKLCFFQFYKYMSTLFQRVSHLSILRGRGCSLLLISEYFSMDSCGRNYWIPVKTSVNIKERSSSDILLHTLLRPTVEMRTGSIQWIYASKILLGIGTHIYSSCLFSFLYLPWILSPMKSENNF